MSVPEYFRELSVCLYESCEVLVSFQVLSDLTVTKKEMQICRILAQAQARILAQGQFFSFVHCIRKQIESRPRGRTQLCLPIKAGRTFTIGAVAAATTSTSIVNCIGMHCKL